MHQTRVISRAIGPLLRSLAVSLSIAALTSPVQANESILEELRWQARVLLTFAAEADDTRLQAVLDDFANAGGVAERDLVWGYVIAGKEGQIGDRRLSADEAKAIAGGIDIDADQFVVVLIGKDGGVKARWDTPPAVSAVFNRIDGMPMRQREMREQREDAAANDS